MTEKRRSLAQLVAISHRNFIITRDGYYICDDFGVYVKVNYIQTLVSLSTHGWPEDKWWLRGARKWK